MKSAQPLVLLRGGGDLASGVALRLCRSGFAVLITEIEQPLAVRRAVSFAEAIYAGEVHVEELRGRHVDGLAEIEPAIEEGMIPVLVDPTLQICNQLRFSAMIDARMRKKAPEIGKEALPFVIGLGPGFTAGLDCHAVIETNRGHKMGRVIWKGSAEADTGIPEPVRGYDVDRVLRAPADGELHGGLDIGTLVGKGEQLARIVDHPVLAPFDGVLRGLIHDGLPVHEGMKIGDLDPRGIPEYCFLVSDKSLAVGGGVLEALLSQPEIRRAMDG
jgi:xanthine dehydrogenase accessory factor